MGRPDGPLPPKVANSDSTRTLFNSHGHVLTVSGITPSGRGHLPSDNEHTLEPHDD